MSIIKNFDELTISDLRKLGLDKKTPLFWWNKENIPVKNKTDFYYIDSLDSSINPTELIIAYPCCLLFKEIFSVNNTKKTRVYIEDLPNKGIKEIDFSYYYIGKFHKNRILQQTESDKTDFYYIEKITNIAPIMFFNKK